MTIDEFKTTLQGYIGNRTDDETLALLEQLDSVEAPPANDHAQELEQTKALLEQMTKARNDVEAEWREKYRNRFFGTDDDGEVPSPPPDDEPKAMTAEEAAALWLQENGNRYR